MWKAFPLSIGRQWWIIVSLVAPIGVSEIHRYLIKIAYLFGTKVLHREEDFQ